MKNIQVIDNLYKAFATGDIPTVLGSMNGKIVKFQQYMDTKKLVDAETK